MEKKRSSFTVKRDKDKKDLKEVTKRAKGDCDVSASSHTHFLKKLRHDEDFKRVTREEYLSISESISGSSKSFHCVHGPEGKKYTEKGLLKRKILKELDPVPVERKWTEECASNDWDIAKKIVFLVLDPTVGQQLPRLEEHLRDFAKTSSNGYMVDTLGSVSIILEFLIEALPKNPSLKEGLELMLKNLLKPINLKAFSDVVTYFDAIQDYIGFLGFKHLLALLGFWVVRKLACLGASNKFSKACEIRQLALDYLSFHAQLGAIKKGYLLLRMESDDHFDSVSDAVLWQLSAPNSMRGPMGAPMRHCLAAAAPVLYQSVVRMLAVSTSHRFPTFLRIALILACDTVDNCIEMMKENIIENIFYRFNPHFPNKKLPYYDINPAVMEDYNVKLGDSSVNLSTTLSLLLVLGNTTKGFLEENPQYRNILPCPDCYSQRCFVWAYRCECRARDHRHERNTLTVIVGMLLYCFGDQLMAFSAILMPDIMTLSVFTELPLRNDWTRTVNINTSQRDVHFKKLLIYLCVDFLKAFPYNKFMIESRKWLMGLMYLLDPGLCHLRAHWAPPLFAEIRKAALQALICTVPQAPHSLIKEYGLIRRLMWYIEWYSESPYELPVLYWCMRLLQVATARRGEPMRKVALQDLFNSHGIVILMHLCYTLMSQKLPPVEKSQVIMSLALRMMTSAVETKQRVSCCVYPYIKWPVSVNAMARKMMDVVLYSLDKHYIISDRWLISLLNLIWEAIIWKTAYRENFIANNGIYKILDLITMTRAPVQCIALALVCDIARAGDAVGQLVSWRASLGASNANPNVVKRGATIAALMAAIFRDECMKTGVPLDENGILQDLDHPIMASFVWQEMNNPNYKQDKSRRTSVCYPAADLAGSRLSKIFALLHMLSEDLENRVTLADEAYNMYKNIKLTAQDEAILVLCAYYLTMKLNEVWTETEIQNPGLVKEDEHILDEFLKVGRGWTRQIKLKQEDVIDKDRKKDLEDESSLYAFLGRVRLYIALDALRTVRCVARSADRARITHVLLQDAVRAHHRRSVFAKRIAAPVLRTYGAPLDDQNITGQNVKVFSILPKDKKKPMEIPSSSTSRHS